MFLTSLSSVNKEKLVHTVMKAETKLFLFNAVHHKVNEEILCDRYP